MFVIRHLIEPMTNDTRPLSCQVRADISRDFIDHETLGAPSLVRARHQATFGAVLPERDSRSALRAR
jgi:hypothetical protein